MMKINRLKFSFKNPIKLLVWIVLFTSFTKTNDSKNLEIIIVGDWGREGKYHQADVANTMGRFADSVKTDFIISTGDNFYMSGVKSTADSAWIKSFENIYTHPSLLVDWYIVLGNHDYSGNIKAQLDYSNISKRWKLPEQYYFFEKTLPNKEKALFVFMDTNPFEHENYRESYYQHNIHNQDSSKQKVWLENTLGNSKAKWKIVIGHHPLYTGGVRRDSINTVRKSLEPIFEKHKVDVYLCGHEHDLQHLIVKGKHTQHFVSGGGSKLRETYGNKHTKFGVSQHGFLQLSLNDKLAVFKFVDYLGNIIYSYSLTNENQ